MDYQQIAKTLKAVAEPNRLKILNLLTGGEKCACHLQDYFEFSQPTLSHHMRVLIDSGLVKARKEGKWQHYSLDDRNLAQLAQQFEAISRQKKLL